jgi:hypothetical protein
MDTIILRLCSSSANKGNTSRRLAMVWAFSPRKGTGSGRHGRCILECTNLQISIVFSKREKQNLGVDHRIFEWPHCSRI